MRDGDNVLMFLPNERLDRDASVNIGWLCVRHTVLLSDRPEGRFLYWPASAAVSRKDAEYAIPELAQTEPVALHDCGNGTYDLYRGNGSHYPIRLVNAGQTQAILSEPFTIACPKVRKGLETRFHSGQWQKYLKAEGWVAA